MAPACVILSLGPWSSISGPGRLLFFLGSVGLVAICKGFKESANMPSLCARVLRKCGDSAGYAQGF